MNKNISKKIMAILLSIMVVMGLSPINTYAESQEKVMLEGQENTAVSLVENEKIEDKKELFEDSVAPPDENIRFESVDKELRLLAGAPVNTPTKIYEYNQIMQGMNRTDSKAIELYSKQVYADGSNENIKIQSLSNQIIEGKITSYEKLQAIYTWVSQNIYYDWDAFNYGQRGDNSAIGTLAGKKAVCEGYAELSNALIRAAKIPSKVTVGYAGEALTDDNVTAGSNHAWNDVYLDANNDGVKEWIIIDTTWGSLNKYQNRTYNGQAEIPEIGLTPRNSYFNPDLLEYSATHLITNNEYNYRQAYYYENKVVSPIYTNSDVDDSGTIKIPEGTKYIGANVFRNIEGSLSNLKNIILPTTIEAIASGVFQDCNNLDIILPTGVKFIGESAFKNTGLTNLNISGNVKYISEGAFSQCGKLKEITVSENNMALTTENGALYNKSKTILYCYPSFNPATSFTLSSNTTKVAPYAFVNNKYLKTIDLGTKVTSLGMNAFYYNESLETINIPDSVIEVGINCFNGSQGLKTVTIGKNVNNINWCVFSGARILESITVDSENKNIFSKDGVLYGYDMWTGDKKLIHFPINLKTETGTVTLPDDLKNIGYNAFGTAKAFYSQSTVKEIALVDTNNYFSVESGALYNKNKTELTFIPRMSEAEYLKIPFVGKTNISRYDIINLPNLKGIIFAEGFKTLDEGALMKCQSLKKVILPEGFTSIGNYAFYNSPVESIYIPKTVESIAGIFSELVTIAGERGSFAETYAKDNNLKFTSEVSYINSEFGGNVKVLRETEDINKDGLVDIEDIANVAIGYNKISKESDWNNNLDINKDEIIDIFDLVLVAKKFK